MYVQLKERINREASGAGAASEQEEMDLLQRDFQKNKDLVVDLLVKNVLSVNIEVPKVVKGNF